MFTNVDPGTFSVKVVLQGYKTIDRGDIRIGTQQFLTLDLTMEVGAITESVTVTGQSPLIETGNASQGTVLDSAALATLPAPGRAAFMMGSTVPTVIASGDTQFNRQQDQTNISLTSLGGGTRRGNNYVLDGVPITTCIVSRRTRHVRRSASGEYHDVRWVAPAARRVQQTLKSGTNTFRGSAFIRPPVWGQVNNYFTEITRQWRRPTTTTTLARYPKPASVPTCPAVPRRPMGRDRTSSGSPPRITTTYPPQRVGHSRPPRRAEAIFRGEERERRRSSSTIR